MLFLCSLDQEAILNQLENRTKNISEPQLSAPLLLLLLVCYIAIMILLVLVEAFKWSMDRAQKIHQTHLKAQR